MVQHGLDPRAVKSDLYTMVGIDSKHKIKIRSTIWRPYELMSDGFKDIKVCSLSVYLVRSCLLDL